MKIKLTSFAVAPQGTHIARCYRVIDLGTHQSIIKGKSKTQHKLLISFELPKEKHVFDEARGEEPFSVHTRLTASLDQRATLFKLVQSWRGTQWTPELLKKFRTEQLIGRACLLGVIHKEDEGTTYANVDSLTALPKEMECPPAINPPVFFSLDVDDFGPLNMRKVFDALGDGTKAVIRKSPEWQELTGEKPTADSETTATDGESAAAHGVGEPEW